VRELTSCRSCGRYIASDFRFCPYCGAERVRDYRFKHLLDQAIDEMDVTTQKFTMEWLARLEDRILTLETDLDSFLSPQHPS
jgi:hypothetical protein